MKWQILAIYFLLVTKSLKADDDAETTEEPPETTEEPSTSEESSTTKEPKSVKVSKNTTDCDPWPSHLRHPRDCCDIPHNPGSITLNTCFYRCNAREMDEKRQVECAAGCFVNTTRIIIDDRMNRERVKNMFVSGMYPHDRWVRVMEDAVDNCEFDTKANLHSALAKFYTCIDDYLGDHCVNFQQRPDCEKTQELFEDCNKVRFNCDYWPRNLASPEYCCKIPPLFSHQLTSKCKHNCALKELFVQRQQKCIDSCLYNDTKLFIDGKLNYNVIMEMLIESSNKSKDWRKPIDNAVERCKKALGERTSQHPSFGVNYEITTLQTCLRDYLSTDCVEYKEENFCNRVKHFVKHCPSTKPKKNYHFSNQNGRTEVRSHY